MDSTDKEKRYEAFVKELTRISSIYGVAVDTISAPYVLSKPQKIEYMVDPESNGLIALWFNPKDDPFF